MCSMDYEMLVSHSPPVFSHSPPTGGFLTDYAALRLGTEFPRATFTTCRSLQHSNSFNSLPKVPSVKMPAYPKRPCLVIRPTDDTSTSSDEDPTSPTRLKKKVVFADDKGMSLTHVRVMTEPSNVPPLWSYRFLSEVTQGLTADPVGEVNAWEITFPQPASDYVHFRKRLDNENVSLENVILKESEECILGTIKVRNLAFHKEVFVRCSTNDWKSNEDCFCTYVPNNMNININVLYDTFSFKIPLPPNNVKKLEFCICFRCEGRDYWDSNQNKNYVLLKKQSIQRSLSNDDLFKRTEKENQPVIKCNDIVQAKLESWSEFASWTHLENNSPYW